MSLPLALCLNSNILFSRFWVRVSRRRNCWRNLFVVSLLTSFGASAVAEEFNSAAVGIYQEPGVQSNRDFSASTQVDSVDPFTGALKILVTDLRLPGVGGLDISVVRNYQSVTNSNGPYSNGNTSRTPFGAGWDMHFGRLWVSSTYKYLNHSTNNSGCIISQVASNLNPILELPDGSRQVLAAGNGSDYSYITKDRWIGRCLPSELNVNNDGGLIVYSPDGLKYIFNLKGNVSPDKQNLSYLVTRIEDVHGNYLDFDYSAPTTNYHLLKSVTSSDGRYVSFSYIDEGGAIPMLSSVSGGGRTIGYSFVNAVLGEGKAQYLASVNYPDGTKWQYSYNDSNTLAGEVPGRFSISSMISPMGINTSYAYDYRQMGVSAAEKLNVIIRRLRSGVTGSSSSSHEWLYTYTKGYSPSNDVTLERGPSNCVRYEHVGANTIANGASGVDQGLWKIGLLVRKDILARSGDGCGNLVRSEVLTWGAQEVSAQNEMRRHNLLVENSTRAPVLTERIVQQDGTSYTTDYAYDVYGNPVTVSEVGQKSRVTTYTYVRPGGLWILGKVGSQSVSGVAGSIANSYTSTGDIEEEDRYGVVTNYQYFVTGDLRSVTDANGRVTSYENHQFGVPRLIRYPDGGIVSRVVNERGLVTSETNQLGYVTSYSYDVMDRLTGVTPPKGAASRVNISYTFGYAGGVTETLTRSNYRRVREYNQLGQLIKQTESGGSAPIVIAGTYSPSGKPIFISKSAYSAPSTFGESFTYDALDRVTVSQLGNGGRKLRAYLGGNQVQTTDERNYITTHSYAAFGEPSEGLLVGISQPGGVQTTIGVDNLGRTTSIAQGGLTRSYSYDSKGFVQSETNPETGLTQYGYDAVGNILSKKVGAAAADSFSYDSLNRLVQVKYASGSLILSNSYDKAGRLLSQSFGGATWAFGYDTHNKLTSETLTLASPAKTFAVGYSYNAADALVSMTYPSGLAVSYAPDAYGRPTQAGAFASGLSFFANGAIKSLTYGNGRALTVVQDLATLLPTDRQISGSDFPMQLRYFYDLTSNLIRVEDRQNAGYTQVMGYDGLNRLTSATGGWGNAQFAYNSRGDLVSQTIGGVGTSYAYDAAGRLQSLSGGISAGLTYDVKGNVLSARGAYGYDAAGNMSWQCFNPRAGCSSNPDQSFTSDARQRRTTVTSAGGKKRVYVYGQEGRLLREDDLSTGNYKEYVYAASELVASQEVCTEADTDGDGIPDCFESRNSMDPDNPADGAADFDGDGLSNRDEYLFGTKLNDDDSDNDGMPDGWEKRYNLNPLDSSDAFGDLNGDGITNLESYQQGIPPITNWPAIIPATNLNILH